MYHTTIPIYRAVPYSIHQRLTPNIYPVPILNIHFKCYAQRGSDELLSQAAVMAPASDNNNQDLATKKAKLETSNAAATVLGGVGKLSSRFQHQIDNNECYHFNAVRWMTLRSKINCTINNSISRWQFELIKQLILTKHSACYKHRKRIYVLTRTANAPLN